MRTDSIPLADGFTEAQQPLGLGLRVSDYVAGISIAITATDLVGHLPCAEPFASSISPQAGGLSSSISPCT